MMIVTVMMKPVDDYHPAHVDADDCDDHEMMIILLTVDDILDIDAVAANDGDGVEVDRPTQLIFFYSCQQTDTNDMAGQSSKGKWVD